jgi:hypothetical protein
VIARDHASPTRTTGPLALPPASGISSLGIGSPYVRPRAYVRRREADSDHRLRRLGQDDACHIDSHYWRIVDG